MDKTIQASDLTAGMASAQVQPKALRLGAGREAPLRFDPQRRAASPSLKTRLIALASELEQLEASQGVRQRARTRTARQNFILAVEVLGCNLMALSMLSPQGTMAVPRRASVMWSKGRYNEPVYGQHFLDALEVMAHAGMLKAVAKGFKVRGGLSQPSTIALGPAFPKAIGSVNASWASLRRAEAAEVLVLKGPKDKSGDAEAIDYPETEKTRALRRKVRQINRALEAASIMLLDDDMAQDESIPVDPTQRSVRRYFSNGSWYEGGRLFGGFWETMPRQDRFRRIRIGTALHPEGERIANVDFAQLFPRLAYDRCSAKPPEVDLYDVRGDGTCRDGFKALMNAMFFAKAPLTRYPEGIADKFPQGVTIKAAIASILKAHPVIAALFFTGIGLRFMLTESAILIDALGRLQTQGIVALPLHDSVLVASSEAERARSVMAEAFVELNDMSRAAVTIDYGDEYQSVSSLGLP